jgi:uncharacterized protein YlzI (FlbEa/FlbD family)
VASTDLLLLTLIVLTATDGRPIKVNPKDIVSLRVPPSGDHVTKDAHCLVFTSDGKYFAVQESCDQVNSKLQ